MTYLLMVPADKEPRPGFRVHMPSALHPLPSLGHMLPSPKNVRIFTPPQSSC